MIATRWFGIVTASLVTAGALSAHGAVDVPLGGGPAGVEGLRLVPAGHVLSRMERLADADGGDAALKVTFTKEGDVRRFLALEASPVSPTPGAKALALRYRVSLTSGKPPRLAAVIWERRRAGGTGGAWFKVVPTPVAVAEGAAAEFTEGRISLRALRQAAFSDDASGQLEWQNVEKIWIGLVLVSDGNGPVSGSFELSRARFTDEPYRPTGPLRITGDGPGVWNVGKDKAVQASLTTHAGEAHDKGPGGRPCMKFEFTFPGGRHMYAVPTTPMPGTDTEGYQALRFTYRARLPRGTGGLLVMLIERDGAQYFADPAPPASENWSTITIPFGRFKLGGWSRDANGRLDLQEIASVAVACHGTASGTGGTGTIRVTDIEFVP